MFDTSKIDTQVLRKPQHIQHYRRHNKMKPFLICMSGAHDEAVDDYID